MQEFIAEDSVTFEGENRKRGENVLFDKAAAERPRAKCTPSAAATTKKAEQADEEWRTQRQAFARKEEKGTLKRAKRPIFSAN